MPQNLKKNVCYAKRYAWSVHKNTVQNVTTEVFTWLVELIRGQLHPDARHKPRIRVQIARNKLNGTSGKVSTSRHFSYRCQLQLLQDYFP